MQCLFTSILPESTRKALESSLRKAAILEASGSVKRTARPVGAVLKAGVPVSCNTPFAVRRGKPLGFFGRRLVEQPTVMVHMMLREDQADVPLAVPPLLHCMCTIIRESAAVVGIFRKDGSKLRQKKLKDWIERHYSDSLSVLPTSVRLDGRLTPDDLTVHDFVAVLKDYLRELPDGGLLPPSFKKALGKCMTKDLPYVPALCLMLLLPKRNLDCLVYILKFLSDIVSHEEINLMSVENIAICLAPTLLQLENPCPRSLETCQDIVKLLIKYVGAIGWIPAEMTASSDVSSPSARMTPRRQASVMTRCQTPSYESRRRSISFAGPSLRRHPDLNNSMFPNRFRNVFQALKVFVKGEEKSKPCRIATPGRRRNRPTSTSFHSIVRRNFPQSPFNRRKSVSTDNLMTPVFVPSPCELAEDNKKSRSRFGTLKRSIGRIRRKNSNALESHLGRPEQIDLENLSGKKYSASCDELYSEFLRQNLIGFSRSVEALTDDAESIVSAPPDLHLSTASVRDESTFELAALFHQQHYASPFGADTPDSKDLTMVVENHSDNRATSVTIDNSADNRDSIVMIDNSGDNRDTRTVVMINSSGSEGTDDNAMIDSSGDIKPMDEESKENVSPTPMGQEEFEDLRKRSSGRRARSLSRHRPNTARNGLPVPLKIQRTVMDKDGRHLPLLTRAHPLKTENGNSSNGNFSSDPNRTTPPSSATKAVHFEPRLRMDTPKRVPPKPFSEARSGHQPNRVRYLAMRFDAGLTSNNTGRTPCSILKQDAGLRERTLAAMPKLRSPLLARTPGGHAYRIRTSVCRSPSVLI